MKWKLTPAGIHNAQHGTALRVDLFSHAPEKVWIWPDDCLMVPWGYDQMRRATPEEILAARLEGYIVPRIEG